MYEPCVSHPTFTHLVPLRICPHFSKHTRFRKHSIVGPSNIELVFLQLGKETLQ